ncbi:MAG: hypothetical protein M1814_006242 [Vezdaea aestivalis]|nr:MAG: hypothetical protein M1814_006242 [Vezdaea aestivalis]
MAQARSTAANIIPSSTNTTTLTIHTLNPQTTQSQPHPTRTLRKLQPPQAPDAPLAPALASSLSSHSTNLPRPRRRFSRATDSTASDSAPPSSIPLSAGPDIRARRHVRKQTTSNPPAALALHLPRPSSPSSASISAASTSAGHFPSLADLDLRSPNAKFKKGPASHSSNGIETATGPPPALSTQRSYTNESTRRHYNAPDFTYPSSNSLRRGSLGSSSISSATTDSAVEDSDALRKRDSTQTITPKHRSVFRATQDMADRPLSMNSYGEDLLEDDRDRTLRTLEGHGDSKRRSLGQRSAKSTVNEDSTQHAGEDLFLNLARSQSSRQGSEEPASRSEKRRSRIAMASKRQSLPLSSPLTKSALRDVEANGPEASDNREEKWQPQHARRTSYATSTVSQYRSPTSRPYAATAHPFDDGSRLPSSLRASLRDPSPESPNSRDRRALVMTPARSNTYRQSNLSYTNGRSYTTPPTNNRHQAIQDGTESTASTTAPSTVWDELDDLKSRIRKLELTGILPSSSSAAVSQAVGERPRTATTTVTTISSSPKRTLHSPSESTLGGGNGSQVRPLLHAALSRSKSLLPENVYTTLQAASADALSLSASLGISGNGTPPEAKSAVNGSGTPSASDRQLRRKADSLCRSLAELCIVLTDSSGNAAPQSRQQLQITSRENESSPYQRDAVLPSPSALSRLEARRTSLLAMSNGNSPRGSATPTNTQPSSTGHIRRSSTLLRHRRAEAEDEEDDARPFRAPSRAVTDAGFLRSSPRDRLTHEYTSQVPLPEQRSPSVQSSLPLRRHYASASVPEVPPLPQSPGMQSMAARRLTDRAAPIVEQQAVSSPQVERPSLLSKLASPTKDRRSSLGKTGSLVRKLRAATTSHVTESPPVPQIDDRHLHK